MTQLDGQQDPCPQCGSTLDDDGCASCGWFQTGTSSHEPSSTLEGNITVGTRSFTIRQLHRHESSHIRYLATDDNRQWVELIVADSKGELSARAAHSDAHPEFMVVCDEIVETEHGWVGIYPIPTEGTTLVQQLATARMNRVRNEAADLCESLVTPLCKFFEALHARGLKVDRHEAGEIWLGIDGTIRLLDCRLLDHDEQPNEIITSPQFSPPEAYGRASGKLTERSDVFFAGMIMYHCLIRTNLPGTVGLLNDRLPHPLLFHPKIEPELVAVAMRATSLTPAFRYSSGCELATALDWALKMEAKRTATERKCLNLDYAEETHIGLSKQRYCAENQDSAFSAWNDPMTRGFFMVSDGVSISEYGSGDQASQCVKEASEKLWTKLNSDQDLDDLEAISGLNSTMDVTAEFSLSSLPTTTKSRKESIREMLDEANEGIGKRVADQLPRNMLQPEGIMAATAVCAFVEGQNLTYGSIGDSRIYLVRDGHVCTLTREHNYTNRLVSLGRDLHFAYEQPSGPALVQCVGEFTFDERQRLKPVKLKPDLDELRIVPGDTFILCSDGIPDYLGISEELAEQRILALVESTSSVQLLAYELVVGANRGGGGDNLTCVVLKFTEA